MTESKKQTSRVKSETDSNKLAGYIAYAFENGDADHSLDCIGPAAVNQAVKAIASARGMLAPKGIDIYAIPTFFETKTESRDAAVDTEDVKTGIRITVFRHV